MFAKQGMSQSTGTLTLRQVRAVCTQREPTRRVIIVIVAEREEREEKERREKRKRTTEERERERERREERKREKRTHHHQSVSVKRSLLLLLLWTSSGQPMVERDCSGVGSARRRRERRLRSWWRHERMTVAAELAVALHHSRGVGPAVPHEALRDRRLRAQWEGGRVS